MRCWVHFQTRYEVGLIACVCKKTDENTNERVAGRVADPDWNRIQSGQWIRIRIRIQIQESKNDPQKLNIFFKVHVLKCWMASFES
jgi:hypothetical protein